MKKLNTKKVLATAVLPGLLVAPVVTAAPALAAPADTTVNATSTDDQLEAVDKAIAELQEAAKTNTRTDYLKEIHKLLKTAFELRGTIIALATGGVPPFDPATIPLRVGVLAEIGKTIGTATTELTNKVSDAHVEIGFAVTRAVIRMVNPGATIEELKDTLADLKSTIERVSQYPDLGPQDRATIYVKARLDRVIWDTRIKRDTTILGKASSEVYWELNKSITHAVGVWFDPTATVEKVDAEITALKAAYDKALSQVK
ncbi:MAG: CAMP factor family pore-forming toxin [Bowdeniella nasicola]|nr:CAMP factor family pore-forming toxin [Bowdeniella nasicola]